MKYNKRANLKSFGLFLGLILWVCPAITLAKEEVGLRMDVDKRQVEVGDTITLTLEFRQATTGNVKLLGEPAIATPENFEIQPGGLVGQRVDFIDGKTMMIYSKRITLVAKKVGTETFGPAVVKFQNERSKQDEAESNVVSVTVVEKSVFPFFHKKKKEAEEPTPTVNPAPQPADDGIHDIKPLMSTGPSWFLIILGAVIVLLIAGFIWRQVSRSGPPPIPVEKAAQLREIWKKLGKDDLDSKEFCLALSNLVRECLQYRYQFPAVDYTTEEIQKELQKYKPSDDETVAVEKCLKTCDRVLYADGNLTGRDNLRTLCSALLPKKES